MSDSAGKAIRCRRRPIRLRCRCRDRSPRRCLPPPPHLCGVRLVALLLVASPTSSSSSSSSSPSSCASHALSESSALGPASPPPSAQGRGLSTRCRLLASSSSSCTCEGTSLDQRLIRDGCCTSPMAAALMFGPLLLSGTPRGAATVPIRQYAANRRILGHTSSTAFVVGCKRVPDRYRARGCRSQAASGLHHRHLRRCMSATPPTSARVMTKPRGQGESRRIMEGRRCDAIAEPGRCAGG